MGPRPWERVTNSFSQTRSSRRKALNHYSVLPAGIYQYDNPCRQAKVKEIPVLASLKPDDQDIRDGVRERPR